MGSNGPNPTLQTTQLSSDLYFGGRRLAVQDRLGSVGCYYPYGEARGTMPADTWSFGTYWRDNVPGATNNLDYADQRYYSNQFGRFMNPDPYQASAGPSDPGSWNQYAYTVGDPINYNDPSGEI
jgi:RHS repeat-associated protein